MDPRASWRGKPHDPDALRHSHDEARAKLDRAAKLGGPIAEASSRVARMCLPHFEREEKCLLPVLAFLPDLTQGILRPEMEDALPLIADFRARHEALETQHQSIQASIEELRQAALGENNAEFAEFAIHLKLHERIEDQLIYPTVLLIGNHLRAVAPGIWTR